MTAKQKITEILKAYTKKHNISASSVILEEYAEELLANGVIVPPCKVGAFSHIKAEAYKECIDMVKKKGVKVGVDEICIFEGTLNNILKELVGEDNASKN